jgi:hypothetical protein
MKKQRRETARTSRPEPSAELVLTLTTRLKEALAQAETTDFRALDRALFEGVTSTQLATFSREELHRQLVFALAETVLSDGDAQASDWVLEAVRLFLTRLAAALPSGDTPGASSSRRRPANEPATLSS